jgi:putative transcriptional regulator
VEATSPIKEIIARRIAGEIILSSNPGRTFRKWREIFNLTQIRLANNLQITPSVISDYEKGRRSPGTRFIKRFVLALISINEEDGGLFLKELSRLAITPSDAIIDVREFPVAVEGRQVSEAVKGQPLACEKLLRRSIYGYTILDSVKAIQTLSSTDAYRVFGITTERALVFTNVTKGRSPMVAVRVHPLKPRMIIIHGPEKVDDLALQLAEVEQIPLVLSKVTSVDRLVFALNKLYQSVSSRQTSPPVNGL